MAFKLFKKNLPSEEDNKNSKFKDVKNKEDELTEEELELLGGNMNEVEFLEAKRVGKELAEEQAGMYKRR